MIASTYVLAGVTLLDSSLLFFHGLLSLRAQIATFFFAFSAASSAYLAVSEVFLQTIRATSIAFLYAFGPLAGGSFGPLIFEHLTETAFRSPLYWGCVAGASGMVIAGLTHAVWGVAAERKSLESLALTYR